LPLRTRSVLRFKVIFVQSMQVFHQTEEVEVIGVGQYGVS
jgi:hypothetical protein